MPKVAMPFLFGRGGRGSFVNDDAGAIVSFAQGLAPYLGDLLLCEAKNSKGRGNPPGATFTGNADLEADAEVSVVRGSTLRVHANAQDLKRY